MFNFHNYIYGLFIFSMIFVIIGHVFREQLQAVLQKPLLKVPSCTLDWWSVIHFFVFVTFGFYEPNRPIVFLILSIAFEAFEDGMSSDENTQIIKCKNPETKNSLLGKIHCNGYDDSYWYGKWDDIIVNLLGYVIGSSISTTLY